MLNIFGMEVSVKKLVCSAIYIAFVVVLYLILRRILKIIFDRATKHKISSAQKQKIETVSRLFLSLLRYFLLIIVVLVILANLGVNVTSLLAGLGIMTAIFGLAFQDMIKDVIAGVTIIAEDQFNIGDEVEIDSFRGIVSNFGLKTTEVTGKQGQVKIVSNRNMDGIINYSKKQ